MNGVLALLLSLVIVSEAFVQEAAGRTKNRATFCPSNMSSLPSSEGSTKTAWQKEEDDSFVREYETRIEPLTGSFVEAMLESWFGKQQGNVNEVLEVGKGDVTTDNSATPNDTEQTSCLKLLDVGCGTGIVSLIASSIDIKTNAKLAVTSTDVSSAMVERCRQRRIEQQQQKQKSFSSSKDEDKATTSVVPIECVVANGQHLPLSWTNQFDYIVGNFSIIFFPDLHQGLKEIYRCLVPGKGQVVLSAWGNAEETKGFQIFKTAIQDIAPELHNDVKPKRICGSKTSLTELLTNAGFESIKIIGPIERTLYVSSAEEYYNRFAFGSPNIKQMIEELSSSQQTTTNINNINNNKVHALKQKVMQLAEERGGNEHDKSISLPCSAYFAYGTKPK